MENRLPSNVVPLYTKRYIRDNGIKPEAVHSILMLRYPALCTENRSPFAEQIYTRLSTGKYCVVVLCKNRRAAQHGKPRYLYTRTYHARLKDGTWATYRTLLDIDMAQIMDIKVRLCAIHSVVNGREQFYANE